MPMKLIVRRKMLVNWPMMILGLIEIATGVVRFISLGQYHAPWEFDFLAWNTKRELAKRRKAKLEAGV